MPVKQPPAKTTRKLTSLELSAPARGTLRRIKKNHSIPFTRSIERGLSLLEKSLEGAR